MKFTTAELAEIRGALRQRIKTEPTRKRPVRREPKTKPLPPLASEPAYEDGDVLGPGQVAELFDVTPHTVRRWADSGMLPSFRTVGGQRRFRWRQIRRAVSAARTSCEF
jgi:excisionase family DNA binding protein